MAKFSLDDSFGFIINRTAQRLKHELQSAFRSEGYNITPEQWAVLNRLWEKEGQSQKELAEKTFKDKTNITRMLDVLVKRGLVYREGDEHDRRMFKIYLTEQGRALKEDLIPIAAQVLERGGENLTQGDFDHLMETLNKIFNNLD